jgi:hypothetical protein
VIGDGFVMQNFDGAATVDLAYDIIDQPPHFTVNWNGSSGGTFGVSYVMSNDTSGLPQGNPSIVQSAPVFVDAANGDYHLAPVKQKALDFGNGSNYDFADDLDDFPAPVDLAAVPNFLPGSADLGAYEMQNFFRNCGTSDSVFCDGFNF